MSVPVFTVSGWGFEPSIFKPILDGVTSVDQELSLCELLTPDRMSAELGEAEPSLVAQCLGERISDCSEPVCLLAWSTGAIAALETAIFLARKDF